MIKSFKHVQNTEQPALQDKSTNHVVSLCFSSLDWPDVLVYECMNEWMSMWFGDQTKYTNQNKQNNKQKNGTIPNEDANYDSVLFIQ